MVGKGNVRWMKWEREMVVVVAGVVDDEDVVVKVDVEAEAEAGAEAESGESWFCASDSDEGVE